MQELEKIQWVNTGQGSTCIVAVHMHEDKLTKSSVLLLYIWKSHLVDQQMRWLAPYLMALHSVERGGGGDPRRVQYKDI